MENILLRDVIPERDFALMAAWFTILEDSITTEEGLHDDYRRNKDHSLIRVAEERLGQPVGFYWVSLSSTGIRPGFVYLYVIPELRCRGVGSLLHADLEAAVKTAGVTRLKTYVKETWPESKSFADRQGYFVERMQFPMELDLDAFDDSPYDPLISKLKAAGFLFTSMADLGDTEEAQRKLFRLNDDCVVTTMGSDGSHSWGSFDEFHESVCKTPWYNPAGQIVVIDTRSGAWAAMSAISVIGGNDYAYNLFTGVDLPYRGQKLGTAVKITALRYARLTLGVHKVRTHHNSKNEPMIAIDRKFGYRQLPGDYVMEKVLE